jgi:hypothetical protein
MVGEITFPPYQVIALMKIHVTVTTVAAADN